MRWAFTCGISGTKLFLQCFAALVGRRAAAVTAADLPRNRSGWLCYQTAERLLSYSGTRGRGFQMVRTLLRQLTGCTESSGNALAGDLKELPLLEGRASKSRRERTRSGRWHCAEKAHALLRLQRQHMFGVFTIFWKMVAC
jgi:hypothetical protein